MIKKLNNREINKKTIKNKSKYMVLLILMLLSVISVATVSYAVFTVQLKGEKKYSLTIGTLDFSIDNEQNSIRLMNAYPMSDTEGGALRPYTFTLTNTGTLKEYYKVSLITDIASQATCTGCTFLAPNKLRYSLTVDGNTPVIGTVADQTVLEIGELTANQTKNYELRLWLNSEATIEEENKYYYGKIKVDASQEEYKETVTFGGITKEINKIPNTMFNYTSEGINPYGGDSVAQTNGIYRMEDDDGPSYFYRGEVDNLVKFGSYTKDYYVYQYSGYDFSSLEACKYYSSRCSETNKVLKYAASDNVPMYWRIIRVNGDGTIRMIYAGTTPDAIRYDTGIGLTNYADSNQLKYAGYTYDRNTTEVESKAKIEVDRWYKNTFKDTVYDSKIATGKFCSDSSGYEDTGKYYSFASLRRFGTWVRLSDEDENSIATFKCDNTEETFGGLYNLKAGLITSDEVIAAGSQATQNDSFYLYNGEKDGFNGVLFWTMTPLAFEESTNSSIVGTLNSDGGFFDGMTYCSPIHSEVLVRPVINLRADVVFKPGTDGSTIAPYEIVE